MLLKIPKQYRVFVRDPYSGQGRCAPTYKRVLRWIETRIHFIFHCFLCLWYLISLTIDISHISSLWYLMCFTFDLFNIWCLSYFISDSNTVVHKYWKMSRLKSKMKYDFRSAATNCARIIATQRRRCNCFMIVICFSTFHFITRPWPSWRWPLVGGVVQDFYRVGKNLHFEREKIHIHDSYLYWQWIPLVVQKVIMAPPYHQVNNRKDIQIRKMLKHIGTTVENFDSCKCPVVK